MKFALSIDLFVYEQYLCSLQCRLVALTHITENITSFGIGVNPLTLLLSLSESQREGGGPLMPRSGGKLLTLGFTSPGLSSRALCMSQEIQVWEGKSLLRSYNYLTLILHKVMAKGRSGVQKLLLGASLVVLSVLRNCPPMQGMGV